MKAEHLHQLRFLTGTVIAADGGRSSYMNRYLPEG